MSEEIKRVKLLAIRTGTYTLYVFKDLESGAYLMCTRLPNWSVPEMNIGDEGFLQIELVKAGEKYFDVASGEYDFYKYSNVYFKNFMKKMADVTNSEIIM